MTYREHGVQVFCPPVITQIIGTHGEELRESTLRRGAGGLAAAVLLKGKRGPNPGTPRMHAASRHGVQFVVFDLLEQSGAFGVERCAWDRAEVRIDALGPREAEGCVRAFAIAH